MRRVRRSRYGQSIAAGYQRNSELTLDACEMLVVLSGGCRFDDGLAELGADDTIVIEAHTRYGFTCGDAGMEFLTIRIGEANVSLAD